MSGSMPPPSTVNVGTKARESRVILWLMEGGQPLPAEKLVIICCKYFYYIIVEKCVVKQLF